MTRNVLEVETPILSESTASDPHLASIPAIVRDDLAAPGKQFYLHTSPEFPMKRLLASGSGPIYQIAKTFRDGETGKRHNPEFSMLEWYRPGFTLMDLMDEVSDLVREVLDVTIVKSLSYHDAFQRYLGINPFTVSNKELARACRELCQYEGDKLNRDDYLNMLLATKIEPNLGKDAPEYLYQYPATQASLAQTREIGGYEVADRFELYISGLEIANGYFELIDPVEQGRRFSEDNKVRSSLGLPMVPLDQNLIQALEAGMPSCSGVALGLDRLLMIQQNVSNIDDVIPFPIHRA